jgi:hypothetical protein
MRFPAVAACVNVPQPTQRHSAIRRFLNKRQHLSPPSRLRFVAAVTPERL